MDKLKLSKAELHKDGKSVTLTFGTLSVPKNGEPFDSDNKITIHKEPSEDLSNAFLSLVPHLLWIPQLHRTKADGVDEYWFNDFVFVDNEDMPEFKGVNVTGIEISGKDNDFVQLIGTKTTDRLEIISIKTPKIWLDDASEKAYFHSEILGNQVKVAMKEAELFYNGKFKPSNQQDLFKVES